MNFRHDETIQFDWTREVMWRFAMPAKGMYSCRHTWLYSQSVEVTYKYQYLSDNLDHRHSQVTLW